MEKRTYKRLITKVTNLVLNILIGVFAVILFVSLYMGFQIKVLGNDHSNFFGYTFFETQTGSMKDEINPGDWIVVKLTKDVEVNDVITYRIEDDFVTHRIIEAYKGTYVTKGDNNNSKDDPINESQIIGKVIKVLPGFGIIRKTFFNKLVILALIVTLFCFNLVFKKDSENNKFERYVKDLIRRGASGKRSSEETYSKEQIKEIEEVLNKPIEQTADTLTGELLKAKIEEEPTEEVISEDDELSRTSVYRIITVNEKALEDKINTINDQEDETEVLEEKVKSPREKRREKNKRVKKEAPKEEVKEEIVEQKEVIEEIQEESIEPIISVDTNENKALEVPKKEIKKEVEEEVIIPAKEVKPRKKDIGVNNYKANQSVELKSIDLDDMKNKLKTYKAKNIIDKTMKIKELEITEILNLLISNELEYVKKSSLKDDFVNAYLEAKYYNPETIKSSKKIVEYIEELCVNLAKKYAKNENQQKAINILGKQICIIEIMDYKARKEENIKELYEDILSKNNEEWDIEFVRFAVAEILKVQKSCDSEIEGILTKMETKMFSVDYNRFLSKGNLYGVVLGHNLSFSAVYSDFIVDKVYNEGIIAEDKIEVLLTMLSKEVTSNIFNRDFNKEYVFYLPSSLFEKEKKLEGLFKSIENIYAKKHVYILVDIKDLKENKKLIQKLKKSEYRFATVVDNVEQSKYYDLGSLELVDFIIVDRKLNISVTKDLPKDAQKKVIKENISKVKD